MFLRAVEVQEMTVLLAAGLHCVFNVFFTSCTRCFDSTRILLIICIDTCARMAFSPLRSPLTQTSTLKGWHGGLLEEAPKEELKHLTPKGAVRASG